MIQNEKDLLLKDLSARLPYDVKVFYEYVDSLNKKTYGYSLTLNTWCIDEMKAEKAVVKPYLFPLSSMTEEQWNNAPTISLTNFTFESFKCECFTLASYTCDNNLHDLLEFIDWLIANHFDIHNLIPMGLAIDVTGLNIY